MNLNATCNLTLGSLEQVPVVRRTAPFYQEKCMVCFDSQGHGSGVTLNVIFKDSNSVFRIYWSGEVTEQMRMSHADLQEAVEFAACAVTFLLVPELTGLTTIRQAAKGTTFDYYLAPSDKEDLLIFNDAACLEISGILVENDNNSVESRIRGKLKRLKQDPSDALPTFISVVEFSQPWSKVVEA